MMYTILFISSLTLLLVAWILSILSIHKRHTSEIIRRLEEHHEASKEKTFFLQQQAENSLKLSDEILTMLRQQHERPLDDEMDFMRTDRFKPC